jgi:hypothetical protein
MALVALLATFMVFGAVLASSYLIYTRCNSGDDRLVQLQDFNVKPGPLGPPGVCVGC